MAERPSAALRRILAGAAEVLIVEAPADEAGRADAARTVVTGADIEVLAGLLAVVDDGPEDLCRCRGWPTLVVRDASGAETATWTLHHQAGIRGLGEWDVDLRDGAALTDWLAGRGLTGSRAAQEALAKYVAEDEARRAAWLRAAPADLTAAAEAAARGGQDDELRLADLVAHRYPDAERRIRMLVAWAGFPARYTTTMGGTPWAELAPERMLLTEPAETVFAALTAAPLTAEQLDGATELVTTMEWTAGLPEPLRAQLLEHVTATGTEGMLLRMRRYRPIC